MTDTDVFDCQLTIEFEMPDGKTVPGYKYTNPDGSLGGLVAQNAYVHNSAIIEEGAWVLPGATVKAHAVIYRGITVEANEIVERNAVIA